MQKLVLYSALSLLLLVSLFVACSKDKFEDKPTIEIKSVGPTQVSYLSGSYAQIELEFTDKQGDLDSVFLYKNRLNRVQKPLLGPVLDFKLPTFPEKSKGEIKLTLDAASMLVAVQFPSSQQGAPNNREPDTIFFKIIVKDKAGNVSDTATTEPLVIERS
jgi:hypothetical protein